MDEKTERPSPEELRRAREEEKREELLKGWGNYGDIDPITGLALCPPPFYPNGIPRRRICRKCKTIRNVSEFAAREVYPNPYCKRPDGGIFRNRKCKTCWNMEKSLRQTLGHRRWKKGEFQALLSEIGECSSSEQIMGIVDRVAEECNLTLEGIVELFVETIKEATPNKRITAIDRLLYMTAVCELERLQPPDMNYGEIDPVDYVEYLAEEGKLAPLIHQMVTDGLLDIDMIDPPPDLAEFE